MNNLIQFINKSLESNKPVGRISEAANKRRNTKLQLDSTDDEWIDFLEGYGLKISNVSKPDDYENLKKFEVYHVKNNVQNTIVLRMDDKLYELVFDKNGKYKDNWIMELYDTGVPYHSGMYLFDSFLEKIINSLETLKTKR